MQNDCIHPTPQFNQSAPHTVTVKLNSDANWTPSRSPSPIVGVEDTSHGSARKLNFERENAYIDCIKKKKEKKGKKKTKISRLRRFVDSCTHNKSNTARAERKTSCQILSFARDYPLSVSRSRYDVGKNGEKKRRKMSRARSSLRPTSARYCLCPVCRNVYFPSIISDVIDQIGRSHDRVARSAAIDKCSRILSYKTIDTEQSEKRSKDRAFWYSVSFSLGRFCVFFFSSIRVSLTHSHPSLANSSLL